MQPALHGRTGVARPARYRRASGARPCPICNKEPDVWTRHLLDAHGVNFERLVQAERQRALAILNDHSRTFAACSVCGIRLPEAMAREHVRRHPDYTPPKAGVSVEASAPAPRGTGPRAREDPKTAQRIRALLSDVRSRALKAVREEIEERARRKQALSAARVLKGKKGKKRRKKSARARLR